MCAAGLCPVSDIHAACETLPHRSSEHAPERVLSECLWRIQYQLRSTTQRKWMPGVRYLVGGQLGQHGGPEGNDATAAALGVHYCCGDHRRPAVQEGNVRQRLRHLYAPRLIVMTCSLC